MIELDGAHGEGGGSILRQSLALSILTKKPFRITQIRANRPSSGLKPQHLASLQLAQKICNAKLLGAQLGSTEIEFYPGDLSSNEITYDIGSAGSITLALQSIILPCLFFEKKIKLNLKGGTDVAWSTPIDYFKEIYLPCIEDYGKLDCLVSKKGFYPKGGGLVSLSIQGLSLNKPFIRETPGKLIAIKCILHTSKNFWKEETPEKTTEIIKMSFSELKIPISINTLSSTSDDEGGSILFYALFENPTIEDKFIRTGYSEIFRDDRELTKVISIYSNKLKTQITKNIPVDEYLTDQLIPFLGVVGGSIITENISNHSLSNIYVTEKFCDKKFEIDILNNKISCK
ncbi:MAG: RNA 3'-terminal phosphate cyclase [Candidatus Woesearchaeota archaeon]|jgi:RNA 3'-terminal phosphate cyclase (GTP)